MDRGSASDDGRGSTPSHLFVRAPHARAAQSKMLTFFPTVSLSRHVNANLDPSLLIVILPFGSKRCPRSEICVTVPSWAMLP